MDFSMTLFLFLLCYLQHVGCSSQDPKMTSEDLYIIYLVNNLQIHKRNGSFFGVTFQVQRWSHCPLGIILTNQDLDHFCVSVNGSFDQKWYIQSANPQTLSQLWALYLFLFLLTPSKVNCVTPANQIFSIFSHPCSSFYKPPCSPPHFATLSKLKLLTSWSTK